MPDKSIIYKASELIIISALTLCSTIDTKLSTDNKSVMLSCIIKYTYMNCKIKVNKIAFKQILKGVGIYHY